VVASRSAHRRETCLKFGADAVHAFDEDEPGALEATLGGAPHIVAEGVGKEGMLDLAGRHVRMGGAIVSLGMCTRHEGVLPAALAFKEARMIFPLAYSTEEFEATARAFEAEGFNPEIAVSHILPLERLDQAMADLRAGAKMQKVHIDPRLAP
jgi:threonine dehydrogenase-like Zn-dependent dehydrogenase